jgi:hypothetical protein
LALSTLNRFSFIIQSSIFLFNDLLFERVTPYSQSPARRRMLPTREHA